MQCSAFDSEDTVITKSQQTSVGLQKGSKTKTVIINDNDEDEDAIQARQLGCVMRRVCRRRCVRPNVMLPAQCRTICQQRCMMPGAAGVGMVGGVVPGAGMIGTGFYGAGAYGAYGAGGYGGLIG